MDEKLVFLELGCLLLSGFDFDDYNEDYDSILNSRLAAYGDVDYFGEYKARLMRKMLHHTEEPKKILDFGCGVGRNLPHLQTFFPNAKLFAFDISRKSLTIAARGKKNITAIDEDVIDSYEGIFDAVFISGVIHHVEPANRAPVIQRIRHLLAGNGKAFVFEHNPYNPITRRIVKDCEFDKDVALITKGELTSLFARNQLYLIKSSYTFFVPPKLKCIDFIEFFLSRLPLGGQYCAVFVK